MSRVITTVLSLSVLLSAGAVGAQPESRPEIRASRSACTSRRPTASAASAARSASDGVTPSKRSPNSSAMKSVESAPARKREWRSTADRNDALCPGPRI